MEPNMTQLRIFNDNWKHYFSREKEKLLSILKGQDICDIEHIGATSVVLCKTAGTIDILISIPDMVEMFTIKNLLVKNGYRFVESMSNDLDELVFMRVHNGKVVCTVRLMEQACDKYRDIILFKCYLRASKKNVIKYNEYREILLKNCHGDGALYHQGKVDYITSKLAAIKPQE